MCQTVEECKNYRNAAAAGKRAVRVKRTEGYEAEWAHAVIIGRF